MTTKEVKYSQEPWEIIERDNGELETTVTGPIKVRYRRTLNVSEEERAENIRLMTEEAEANAHLIIAAPDLLEAAKPVLALLQPGWLAPKYMPVLCALQEAITKAEGG